MASDRVQRLQERFGGLVDRIDRRRWWVAATLVAVGLLIAWALALRSQSPTAVSRHWFYVPVVFAAVRFGLAGAISSGIAATILAGPAVFTVSRSSTASYAEWATRGAFFLGIGVLIAGLLALVRHSQVQTLRTADVQKQLAYQRSTLIQTVSHEFRTPLTILHGGIKTLERQQENIPEALRPLIGSLARAERRLEEMVSVILATAEAMDATQRVSAEPVNLHRMIDEVTASLEHFGGPRRVQVEIAPDAQTVVTVATYLQVALRCLIDNALRFSPPEEPVTVTAVRHDDTQIIGIHDKGPGIAPDFLDKAFEPFTQSDASTQRQHGGLGIGLFTALRTIERLHGTINLNQPETADEGTTVEIVLPQRRELDRVGQARPTTPVAQPD